MKNPICSRTDVIVTALALVLLSCGCVSPYGSVAKEWSRMMREQQVSPIFPPREDIRVGDIFLSEVDPNYDETLANVENYLPIPLFLATISLDADIINEYKARGEFAASPSNMFSFGTNGTVTDLLEARTNNLFSGTNSMERLRQVAFPDFSYAKVNKSSIQAVIPIHGLNALLGANSERYTEGSLKITSGESYGLPAKMVNTKVLSELTQPGTSLIKEDYANIIRPILASQKGKEPRVWLTVLTEAFYARSIDLSFSSKGAFGAAGGVNPSLPGQASLLSSNVVESAKLVSAMNSNILSQTQVGGSLSVVHATQNDILMRRNFLRPIAVGFRGYVIAVSEDTGGHVVISGTSSQTGTGGRHGTYNPPPNTGSSK